MLNNKEALRQILKRVDQVRGMPEPTTHKNDRRGYEPHVADIHHLLSDLYIELKDIHLHSDYREFEFMYAEKTAAGEQQIRSFFCKGSVLADMLEAVEAAEDGAAREHNKVFLKLALMADENPDLIEKIRPHLRKPGAGTMAYQGRAPSSNIVEFPEPAAPTRH